MVLYLDYRFTVSLHYHGISGAIKQLVLYCIFPSNTSQLKKQMRNRKGKVTQ